MATKNHTCGARRRRHAARGNQLCGELLEDRRLLAVFTVTNLDDSGIGSLRQAIEDSNVAAGPDEIVFGDDLAGTIDLTSGEMGISDDLLLRGPGREQLTIDAADSSRIFKISDGAANVGIDGITLSSSLASAISATDVQQLSLHDVRVANSVRALFATEGNVTITDSRFDNNGDQRSGGGAILVGVPLSTGKYSLSIANSVFEDNSTGGDGGAIRSTNYDVRIEDSQLLRNYAGDDGGAIFARGALFNSRTDILRTTLAHNHAVGEGGAIMIDDGTDIVIESSTIAMNHANDGGGGLCKLFGGGETIIKSSTMSGNTASEVGGTAMFVYNAEIISSTIVDNPGTFAGVGMTMGTVVDSVIYGNGTYDFRDSTLLLRNSLVGSLNSTDISGSGLMVGIDPQLAPLADNGGPTMTHAILPGSPLIDRGSPLDDLIDANFSMTDQRGAGHVRVYRYRVDIGAFELQPDELSVDVNGDQLVDVRDLDAIMAAIASEYPYNSDFDITDSGNVLNLADRNAWLVEAGWLNLPNQQPYQLGDANLDGYVDGRDFLAWNNHKFTTTAAWSQGDFDASGLTDGQDFLIWNNNKDFVGADPASNRSDEEDDDSSNSKRMIDLVFAAGKRQ